MEPTNTDGPTGTYGCACRSSDPKQCFAIRYGTDHDHQGEECECQCHGWEEEDDDQG